MELEDARDALTRSHRTYRTVNESHSDEMEKELAKTHEKLIKMGNDFISRNVEYMKLREKEAKWAEESFEFQRFREHHTNELRCVRQELSHAQLEIVRIGGLERLARHSFMKANTLMDRSRDLLKRWCSHDPASRDQLVSKSGELIDELSTEHL